MEDLSSGLGDRGRYPAQMNIKHTIALLVLFAVSASTHRGETGDIKPDSLENWLQIIELSDFRTLVAVDVNGHFFAIKKNEDGDILVASHQHDESDAWSRGTSTMVESEAGENLFGGTFEIAENAHYIVERKINGTNAQLKIACPRGLVYSLKDHTETSIRVRYFVTREGEQTKTDILNQIVHLPKGDG